MISIIIPAHNEEAVIGRCLGALLDGAREGELDIVVACNGCSDRTAERARLFGEAVTVIELERPSKTAALNAADAIAKGFPRLYVDADVILPLSSARRVAATLEQGDVQLASPVAQTVTGASSAAVRAFYDVWLRLPYNRVMVGTGVYGLSEAGRKRFGDFPDIIADDGYVRSRFFPQERVAVEDAPVTVFAPRRFGDLVRVKTRSRLGAYQLAQADGLTRRTSDARRLWPIVCSLPWGVGLPWRLLVYLWLNVIVRLRAASRLRAGLVSSWDRDHAARA